MEGGVINILEVHDLDSFVTSMIEEPITNARRKNYKKNQAKLKRIIYDCWSLGRPGFTVFNQQHP